MKIRSWAKNQRLTSDNLSIKTRVKTITVKNSKDCRNSKKRLVKMNKKALLEYKCTKQILRDLIKHY